MKKKPHEYVSLCGYGGWRLPFWVKPGGYLVDARGREVTGYYLSNKLIAELLNDYYQRNPNLKKKFKPGKTIYQQGCHD